ncbi:uncharacterized protein F54H12.2 [Trichonephila clavipes]|uniref:Uncharacterized protein F54H12.2 n=1 Tax=Trichonephila clavipes TaxID=2585209 RepID=A0A8X6S745_TRICX|nr:uncharacterized protein F54H12.2 [Trichonephila clavipes]
MERCYCTKSELELFGSEKIQLAIDNSSFVEIHPIASISDSNTIEFQIIGLGDGYFDLSHVLLNIQAKILKADGTAFVEADKCEHINYLLNTMFSECHISLNDRQISSESNYAYKTYIQSKLFHSESSQKNFLRAGMFYKDKPGEFDDADLTAAGKNLGLKQRYERVKEGKIFDMCGILQIDLGTQPRLLISGTTVRMRLLKAKDNFRLLAKTGAFRLQIKNISLFNRKCDISSSIVIAHEKALEQALVQMPFTRIETKTFTLSSGLKSVIIPNAMNGILPSRMVFGLISNSAFNGYFKLNPFNFKNYNLSYISLLDNGVQISISGYTPSYKNNLYSRNYLSLFTDLAQHNTNLTLEEYKNNTCLYVFDLTQYYSDSDPFNNIGRSGDISIHLKFDEVLPETVTFLVYMEMQSLIEIDKSRNIFTDF